MVRAVFIEDRSLMLDALKNTINWSERGIEPLGFFTTCDEALPFIIANQPDVVVTDIVMHGMDGLELSLYLHQSELDVKVIIVSAYNRFEYAQKALQAGVFDYFEKPLDFEALADSILRAGKANDNIRQMRSFIVNHREFYRERFFTKLLLGQIQDQQSIRSDAEFLEADKLGGMICAALRFCRVEPPRDGMMNRELTYLMMGKALKDNLGEDNVFGPYSPRDNETVFILTGEIASDGYAAATRLTRIIEEFSEAEGMTVHAGVGGRAEEPAQLNIAYETAGRALDACFAFEENCVMHVDDLPEENNAHWLMLNRFENQLIRAIGIQDAVAMRNAFDRFRGEIGRSYLKSDALRVMMKSIAFKVESMHISEEQRVNAVLERIDRAGTLDAMMETVEKYCQVVCNAVRSSRSNQGRQVVEAAKAYINDHYASEAFNVNSVAEHVSVSPGYLSSIFKKEFGQGIHEYMTSLRIERAREMLIHTDKGIGTIGVEVGYPNPYHFSMNFKKYTNMTPTEYRKKNQT